jgi:hypothetical protein
MNNKDKSKCCGADVKVQYSEDLGQDEGSTCYYSCTKCQKPCDVQPHSTDWQEPTKKTIYDFPKNCKHNKNGWCHLCVIKEIDASYKRGKMEALESMPIDLFFESYGEFAKKGYFHNEEECAWAVTGYNIKNDELLKWKIEQLNQTHREEIK